MAKKKKAQLTDEEKAAKAKEEALLAAAEKEKKTTLQLAFLKEKLDQEEKNSRISLKKLDEQWRTILRKIKADDLRKEISILHQTFERMLDRKDAVIKSLVKDLSEAEKQEAMAVQTHIKNVDHLVEFHESLMAERHGKFNDGVGDLKEEFVTERNSIIDKHEKEMSNIKDMLFAMQMLHEDYLTDLTDEFSSKRDEIKTKSMEAIEGLKQELERTIGDLWDLFQEALQNYKQSNKEKTVEFTTLKKRDREDAAIIERQMRKLNKISEAIAQCKLKIAANQKECDQRNKQLKHEKENVLMHFQGLKERMNKSRAHERVLLTELTKDSREATKALKAKLQVAEGLLRQAEMCRKLETEQEKVLPFYSDSITAEELEEARGRVESDEGAALPTREQAFATKLDGTLVQKHEAVQNFWKRYNKVQLDKLAAQKEHDVLEEENQRLRAILKQYLDGISVSDAVLQQENTLMVVNGRTNAPMQRAVPVGDHRVRQAEQRQAVEVTAGGSDPSYEPALQ